MGDTGIGARVARKEDQRFITGKGRYTDDINLKDQCYAYFVRSPHAHAAIKSISVPKWADEDGVIGVFTGEHVAEDKIGGLICGWMIHSKDGSPMKAGPHPILALGKVRYVGDHVAVVVAETKEQAKAAAARIEVSYDVLPHVVDAAKAQKSKAQIHDVASDNRIFNWSLGDEAATNAAFKNAHHVTKLELINNRLIPNAMEPRAAIGAYDTGSDHFTLYTTSQNPHVARLVISAFHGLAPEHKLRVIAPDVGGGFGSKIFIYAEEVVCLWASKRIGGRPIKWTAERTESFLADAHGRDHVTTAELAMDAEGRIKGFKVHTIAALGAYMSTFSSCVPTYLYATLLSGQYNIPNIYAVVDAVYTNTAPVDAYRGAG
ncbi:MAG: xanthine dehydrogenase family protein molybdopterin-binding subunit, partial [Parvibaculaceae bacterium]